MDITDSLAPASDQLDAIELAPGPRIFTIEGVSRGTAEQPVNVHLVDFPRPWRPAKSMRRVLAACWGTDASTWAGRRVELYFDPEVRFGKDQPGGTRIKRLSHITETKRIPLLVARGKSANFIVDPLPEQDPTDAKVEALKAEWANADADRRAEIEAEVARLRGASQ